MIHLLQASNAGIFNFILIGLMFIVFYFFMMRPQIKKQKEEKKFQESLKPGSWVVTSGGIHGRVSEVSDKTINIETSAGKIKIEKTSISAETSIARYN